MIRPLGQRVLLEKTIASNQTASGIVLPDTASEERHMGKVVALGTGKRREDGTRETFDVEVGDNVLYHKYAATETKIDSVTYLLLDEKDILAIVE